MRDPDEGLDANGYIRTGASLDRIPDAFRPVLAATVAGIEAICTDASVYAYGSVATGQAVSPASDVDILTVGLDTSEAQAIAAALSSRFRDRCRGVEIATASAADLNSDTDESYGFRVFLHHYCVHLAGPDLDPSRSGYPGDRRAARGFNGDLAIHHARWISAVERDDPDEVARVVARKTLLAVGGLVSVRDETWTTDRERAASRWTEIDPVLAPGLDELVSWTSGASTPDRAAVRRSLNDTVATIVEQFAETIGLWTTSASTDER